jgi:hypothetical protein
MYGTYWRYTMATERDSDDAFSALNVSAASAASIYRFTALEPMRVVRLGVLVVTTLATSGGAVTEPIYDVSLNTTYGTTGTQKMTVTIPSAGAAGHTYYAEDGAFDVDPGHQVDIGKHVASVGLTAGAVVPFIQWYKRAEVDANFSAHVTKVTA